MTKKVLDFGQAEKNARLRDLEAEKQKFEQQHNEVSKEELEKAMETMAKATGKELYIGTKKSPQSKVRFVQIMQENLNSLYEKEYLTSREKVFLMDIMPYVSFASNSLVFDIKAKSPVPMNISELAKTINVNRSRTNETVNSLVKKGLIFKGESGIEGFNGKAYVMFINPHILYAGDKDHVPEHLQVMFHKAMKIKALKELPNKLF